MSAAAELPLVELDASLRAWLAGDVAQLRDPYPLFAALRAASPVHELGSVVVLSRYDDVKVALREVDRFSSRVFVSERAREAVAAMTPQQPADHERSPSTTRSASHTPTTSSTCGFGASSTAPSRRGASPRCARPSRPTPTACWRRSRRPGGRFRAEPAYRLPLFIITDLLGVPESDHDVIHDWSLKIGASRGMFEPNVLSAARAAIDEFGEYLASRTAEPAPGAARAGDRRGAARRPGAGAADAGGADRELRAAAVRRPRDHHNLIATGLLSLLEARPQWELLCRDPVAMAPKATEELLRYVSPVQLTQRVAREDARFGDVEIPEGRHIIMLNASANRDETVFERPEEVDLERVAPATLDLGFDRACRRSWLPSSRARSP